MLPDLVIALNRLEADIRAGALDRSALFWLKTFVMLAVTNDGVVRSDRWVEEGLALAAHHAGPIGRRAGAAPTLGERLRPVSLRASQRRCRVQRRRALPRSIGSVSIASA